MPDCEQCGNSLTDPRDKNAAGWWRDRCLPCISDSVTAPPRDENRPPEQWLRETDAPEGWDDDE